MQNELSVVFDRLADPNKALDRYEAIVLARPTTPEECLAALPGTIDAFEAANHALATLEERATQASLRVATLQETLADLLLDRGCVCRNGVVYRRDESVPGFVSFSALTVLDGPSPSAAEARP